MKTAFITGAGKGLGLGFAMSLLNSGYRVFGGLREFTENLPTKPNLTWVRCDVTSDQSLDEAYISIAAQTESLEILVNNAGVNSVSATLGHSEKVCTLKELDRKFLLDMFNVNAVSPLLVLKKFSKLMTAEPSFVVNVSSCRASYHDEFENSSANYGYRASKAALNMITNCTVTDLPSNVKVFAVHPGSVRTDMNPEGDSEPEVQATKIIAITENWKQEFNGKFLNFDGSYYPL